MIVRYPEMDFSSASPQWGDNTEAVVVINAGAVLPAAIERYMIQVMRRAQRLLDPTSDAALIADLQTFNKQEGQHLKLHAAYLDMLRDGGYPRIGEFETGFAADLDRFLAEESLEWNMAYCEGFESSGAAMARAWVDGDVAAVCGDHGSVPMQLWRWHLAEEFEHRTVVHRMLHRLYGGEKAFALRKSGADFNRAHLAEHSAKAAEYLHEVNRRELGEAEIEASKQREQDAWLAVGMCFGEALNWVYAPDYDPATISPPNEYETTLAAYTPAG